MRNTANKYHWWVWGVLAVSGSHWVCPRSRRVCFPGLHCLGSRLLCLGTFWGGPWVACISQIYTIQVLGYSTKAQIRACGLCPSQVQAAQATRCLVRAHSPGAVRLITSLVPAAGFPGCTAASQVCLVSPLGSWSLAATLLMDVNYPVSQEDLVNNWEPARSLAGDSVSGAEFASFLLALAGARLPPYLQQGMGQSAAC